MIFVCSATHKTKSMFFFLAQTEQGDIFKVTLETDEEMVSSAEALVAGCSGSAAAGLTSAVCVSGDRNQAEILRHHPRGSSHVCPEDGLPVCGVGVWKPVGSNPPSRFVLVPPLSVSPLQLPLPDRSSGR